MRLSIILFALFVGTAFNGIAQDALKQTEIVNGSAHLTGSFPYTKFLKKYKGESDLVIHVWYNATSSSLSKKEIKAGADEIYFLYGRNQKTGLSEMAFKFGSGAQKAFSKKKEDDLVELIDFFQFDVFPEQKFNSAMAREALDEALE